MKYFYCGVGVLVVTLALVFWKHTDKPAPGEIYLRAAHDSSVVARAIVSDSAASPLAKQLVTDLLTRELLVRIEKTGRCGAVMDHYDALNLRLQATKDLLEQAFLAARPVQLYEDDQLRCFAYSITYHIPLPQPMNWRNHLLTKVPLQLTLIHPMDDFKHFKPEPND